MAEVGGDVKYADVFLVFCMHFDEKKHWFRHDKVSSRKPIWRRLAEGWRRLAEICGKLAEGWRSLKLLNFIENRSKYLKSIEIVDFVQFLSLLFKIVQNR